jgi:hypothetical protein
LLSVGCIVLVILYAPSSRCVKANCTDAVAAAEPGPPGWERELDDAGSVGCGG